MMSGVGGGGRGVVADPQITDILRRLSNLIRDGKIVEVDADGYRCKVRTGGAVTKWIPWLTARAGADREWWAPSVGESVLLLSPGGELANAYALPAKFSDANPPPANVETVHRTVYADGAVIEYDRQAHRLRATIPGEIVAEATGNVTMTSGGDVSVTAAGAAAIKTGGATSITSAGAVTISAPAVAISGGGGEPSAATLKGDFILEGSLAVTGNISASGSIMDGAGNSNHHSH